MLGSSSKLRRGKTWKSSWFNVIYVVLFVFDPTLPAGNRGESFGRRGKHSAGVCFVKRGDVSRGQVRSLVLHLYLSMENLNYIHSRSIMVQDAKNKITFLKMEILRQTKQGQPKQPLLPSDVCPIKPI